MDAMKMIPRLEDLPYETSPPIEFVYQKAATLTGGAYTWADTPSVLTPERPLMVNARYYFRSLTLSANVEELDFTSNMTSTIMFYTYLKSRSNAILFREPILMVKYFQNFDYRLVWNTHQEDDKLLAGFTGVITQGAGLIGKSSITLTAIISAQEIVDEKFISLFKEGYPYVK